MGCSAARVRFETAAVSDLQPIFPINPILIYRPYRDYFPDKNSYISFY